MSFDVFDRFASDEKAEITGVWVDLDKASGARAKIARHGNAVFESAFSRFQAESAPALDELEGKTDAESIAVRTALINQITARAYAEAILLDFENISYAGKPIKYSKANALKLLGHRHFLEAVFQQAVRHQNFKAKLEAEQEKNS